MFKTPRVVDPLKPEYKLPTFETAPFEIPKFLGDSFNVSDIEGAQPKPKYLPKGVRHNHDVSDIEGTNASWKSFAKTRIEAIRNEGKSKHREFLDVEDICGKGFQSDRCSNPLRPEYLFHGDIIRDCERSRPRTTKPQKNTPFFSLHTSDIRGAQGGTASSFAKLRLKERVYFKHPTDVSDIPGTLPNVARLRLNTKRTTDPLGPRYIYLHGSDSPSGGKANRQTVSARSENTQSKTNSQNSENTTTARSDRRLWSAKEMLFPKRKSESKTKYVVKTQRQKEVQAVRNLPKL